MAHVVFTYGTLLSERVLLAVLGRVPERADGTLRGYQRTPIRDACYPAVIRAEKDTVVQGKILLGISTEELITLDAFEDSAYERVMVDVRNANGENIQARLWARPDDNQRDLILDADWDFGKFELEDEDWYIADCTQWASKHRGRSDGDKVRKDEPEASASS